MILGIGIDAVEIERMSGWCCNKGLLARFFHPHEIYQLRQRGNIGAESLAARFAAKEAFGKALGCGLAGLSLRSIRVKTDATGKPSLLLCDNALTCFKRMHGTGLHLSLTHERTIAIAVVIIEGDST